MQCPFCSAANPRSRTACSTCGGPLGAARFPPPHLKAKNVAAPATTNRVAVPLPAIASTLIAPAPSLLLARCVLEKNVPRIVAALWLGESGAALPLLVAKNGALWLWDVRGNQLHLLPLHPLAARRAFHLPGQTTNPTLSPTTGAVLVSGAGASPGFLLATCRESGQICLQRLECDAARGTWKSTALPAIQAHQGRVGWLAVAESRLYSAGSDGAVVLTLLPDLGGEAAKETVNYEPQVILDGLDALSCLALSPDGRWLALGGDDGQVQMWQLGGKGMPTRLDWRTGKSHWPLKSLGFSPNGNMLLCHDAQGGVCLRAARTGHELQAMSQQLGAPMPVFAPDSRLLAFANSNGIELFDAWTGELRHSFAPVPGEMWALSFAPTLKAGKAEAFLVVAGSQQFTAYQVAF